MHVGYLTIMLLVANFANTKWCKKPEKMTETLARDLRGLSKSYPMNINMTLV